MGVYTRPDSKFYWLLLERPNQRALREGTKILVTTSTSQQDKENLQLAEQIYHTRMAALVKQQHGIPLPPTEMTLAGYADWYRDHRTSKKATAARERSAIKHLVKHLGPRKLMAIDRYAAQEYLTARTRQVLPSTANREMDVLKDMLTWAVPKYLQVNPLLGMKRLRGVRRGIRILSFAEELRLKRVIQQQTAGKLEPIEGWALFVVAIDSFMRLGDLTALTPDQVHKTYIHVEDPKVGPYDVALSARAQKALAALRKRDLAARWIFPTLRKGRGPQAAEQQAVRFFAAACEAAGVPHGRAIRGVTFHSLRHTGATRFMAAGGTLRDLMQQGGWADIESVMRYAHPSDELVAAVTRASRSSEPRRRRSRGQSRAVHAAPARVEKRP